MDRLDRQRLFFGAEGQERLRASTVGVVGGGGLGSFVVLELAYLGIGKILIVDHDRLECSNRNRLVGAWESHALGTPKVGILRDLASLVDAEIEVEAVETFLEDEEAKASLAAADVVVGCVDHDGPRFTLNRLCCEKGLPLVDAASDTIVDQGGAVFGGRVCAATPETGCLMCFGVLDQNEIRDYAASPGQRADQEAIYGVGKETLAESGPAVVTVNGVVASIAVTEVMVLQTGVRPPIPHQQWRGDKGWLYSFSERANDCYYCGLRPAA